MVYPHDRLLEPRLMGMAVGDVVHAEKKRRIRYHHFSWTFTGKNSESINWTSVWIVISPCCSLYFFRVIWTCPSSRFCLTFFNVLYEFFPVRVFVNNNVTKFEVTLLLTCLPCLETEKFKWRKFKRARGEYTPRRLESNNLLISSSVSSSDALGLFPYPSPFSCFCLAFKTSRHLANCGPLLTFRLEFFCLRYRSKLHKNPLNVVGTYSNPSIFLTDNRNVLNFSFKVSADFRFRFFLRFAPNMF